MKQLVVKYTPNVLIETLFRLQAATIHLKDFETNPPIIIYQMGKVGSSSVYRSLHQAGLPNPIYHVHFLDQDNIRDIIQQYYRKSNVLRPKHLFVGMALGKKLLKVKKRRLKVITLVRDPIARAVSDLFENANLFSDNLMDAEGRYQENAIKQYLEDLFADFEERTDYTATWFDREIHKVLKINVYTNSFDHQTGFAYIRKDNVELLILKMELLSSTFGPAMRLFLNTTENVPLLNTNVGNSKSYASQYQQMKQSLIIPEDTCRKIYATRYTRHFYNEAAVQAFVEKWSGRKRSKE